MSSSVETSTTGIRRFFLGTTVAVSALLLSACGGGGDGSEAGAGVTRLGTVSFSVTDAPVTDARKVLVGFRQVQIKYEGDDAPETLDVTEDGSPLVVDLLELQGAKQTTLIQEERVKAGRYEWIRFIIDPETTKILPTIEGVADPLPLIISSDRAELATDDDFEDLRVPSGRIQLIGGFTVPADGVVSYTIDFDLRHSLVRTGGGQYKLKPVLRMTENSEIGHISGYINNSTYDDCADINDDPNNVTITLFDGDLTPGEFDDADSDPEVTDILDDADDVEPITAAIVASEADNQNRHSFEIGFVTAGTYKLALTCGSDNPLADDDESPDLAYEAYATVEVTAGDTAEVSDEDFEAIVTD